MLLLVGVINYFGYRDNANRDCLKAVPGSTHVYSQQAESSLSWKEIFPEGGRSCRQQLLGGQFPVKPPHAPGHK